MEILINAVKNGHQLGNHGNTNSMHLLKSAEGLHREIDVCDTMIREIYKRAGVMIPKTMVYRPGCGLFSRKMIQIVEDKGYRLALGSVYPNDPIMISSTVNYYYLISHLCDGDIVILHDRSWTVPLLKRFLPYLRNNNYCSATIDLLGVA